MQGPTLAIVLVVLTVITIVPLAAYLALTHAGPLIFAGVAVLLALVLIAAAVTVPAVREGRM